MVARRSVRRIWFPVLLVLLVACRGGSAPSTGGSWSQQSPPSAEWPPPAELVLTGHREGTELAMSGGPSAPYNYAPSVLREGDRYRAWWCSQLPRIGPPGDDILYAESKRIGGDFAVRGAPAAAVFTARSGAFDGMHTCDPSVLKVAGRYYLYYTGAAGEHAHGNAIGLASSADGRGWRRPPVARPVVTASHEVSRSNVYGSGQPSALYLDGWFYLMFTDTTASGAGANGAGQFVLRAKDPEFTDRVQALTWNGFAPAGHTAARRERSVVDAFSADWMWVDALNTFAIAHQTEAGTTLTFWDRDFTHHPYRPVLIPGPWREGPGLVRRADGHAPVFASGSCATVPIDVMRATSSEQAPNRLRHFGVDVTTVDGCSRSPAVD